MEEDQLLIKVEKNQVINGLDDYNNMFKKL